MANDDWLELKDGKQFSRLLYTNPVCFLITRAPEASEDKDAGDSALLQPGKMTEEAAEEERQQEPSVVDRTANVPSRAVFASVMVPGLVDPTTNVPPRSSGVSANVMVVTWLTATNNEGRFVMSINRRRHTASMLKAVREFVLCVPVRGMEDLVRDVGSVSGHWGVSKFPEHHHLQPTSSSQLQIQADEEEEQRRSCIAGSRRSRKKKKGPRFPHGIPGLLTCKLGGREASSVPDSSNWFSIQGTVAHMQCCVYNLLEGAQLVDADHYLVLAEVKRAYVKRSYWNTKKNLFQSRPGEPAYLTFYGSQTFGFVDPSGCNTNNSST